MSIKMIQNRAPKDRQLLEFPPPFKKTATPYLQNEFSEITEYFLKQHFIEHLKICKVIVLGDVSVGKTCLISRFCHKIFESTYKSTIGVDFEVERFDILGVAFNLQIWDTAGQERFKCIAQSYYRGAHAIVLVFDLNASETLANCKTWLTEAYKAAGSNNPFIFLVGTKKDLMSQYAYQNFELAAMKLAKKLHAEYWSVSSRTGENVDELFKRIAALSFDESIRKEIKYSEERRTEIGSDLVSFRKNRKRKQPTKRTCASDCS